MHGPVRRDLRWWRGAGLVVILACFFGVVAHGYVARYRIPFHSAAGIYACFVLMLMLLVASGAAGIRVLIEERIAARGRAAILLFVWCLPYLAYAAGTFDFRWLALLRLAMIPALPLSIYTLFPVRQLERLGWQDLLVAGWLLAVLLSHQLTSIWSVPVNLDFMGRLYLIYVAAGCWVFVRRVPELGYDFVFTGRTFRAAGLNFAMFAAIAAPLGVGLHFIQWNPHWQGWPVFFAAFVEIFLFVALLEELFFRGFLQTLVSSSRHSRWQGQMIISCVFGLFHILHAPVPNWRYALLASVAGWFYGSAFAQGGNLMASALAHAMVDTAWRTFFLRPQV